MRRNSLQVSLRSKPHSPSVTATLYAKGLSVSVQNGAPVPPGSVYAKATFGAKGDGATDDTAAFNAALALIAQTAPRGPELVLEPGCYLLPNGISESVPGLVMRGIGARVQGPGNQASLVGVTLKAITAGAWVWKHLPPTASSNEYRGVHFSDFTLQGAAATAGGLQVQTCYGVFERLGSCNNRIGTGFQVKTAAAPIDSAAENIFHDCMSCDDLIGMEIGESGGHGSSETQVYGFINLKTTAGGIKGTGYGILVWDNNSQIHGGKLEENDTGIIVKSTPGVNIIGTRFEANTNWNVDLYRDSGTNGTRNLIMVAAGKIRIGPFQVKDMVVGGGWEGAIVNQGTGSVILSNF